MQAFPYRQHRKPTAQVTSPHSKESDGTKAEGTDNRPSAKPVEPDEATSPRQETHQENHQNTPPQGADTPDAPKSRGGYLDNIQQHMRRFVDVFAKAVELDNTDLMHDRMASLQKLTAPSQIRPLLKSLKAIFPDKSLPQYARDVLRSKGLSEEEISSPPLSPAKKKRWLHTPEAKDLTSIIQRELRATSRVTRRKRGSMLCSLLIWSRSAPRCAE